MKNPILIVVAICASCAFPPLLLVTVPMLIAMTKHEQHRLQGIQDRRLDEVAAKRRAKAIRAFASSS